MIDISKMEKADVLRRLYNRAKPQGMGFLHYDPKPMTKTEAQQILDSGSFYFDYVKGRVMKVAIKGDSLDPALYDRDNGHGAALDALTSPEA
jgi:hypothetical protein